MYIVHTYSSGDSGVARADAVFSRVYGFFSGAFPVVLQPRSYNFIVRIEGENINNFIYYTDNLQKIIELIIINFAKAKYLIPCGAEDIRNDYS